MQNMSTERLPALGRTDPATRPYLRVASRLAWLAILAAMRDRTADREPLVPSPLETGPDSLRAAARLLLSHPPSEGYEDVLYLR